MPLSLDCYSSELLQNWLRGTQPTTSNVGYWRDCDPRIWPTRRPLPGNGKTGIDDGCGRKAEAEARVVLRPEGAIEHREELCRRHDDLFEVHAADETFAHEKN